MKACCEEMEQQLQPCDPHRNECPEKVIRLYSNGSYGMPYQDGSYQTVRVCPFCGAQLQQWGHHDYEQIELNAGNVEFARELMQRVNDRAEQIAGEIHYIKTGKRYSQSYQVDSVDISDKVVQVYMRYPRPHDRGYDDTWVDTFPAEYLYDKDWEEKFRAKLNKA